MDIRNVTLYTKNSEDLSFTVEILVKSYAHHHGAHLGVSFYCQKMASPAFLAVLAMVFYHEMDLLNSTTLRIHSR